MEEKLTYINVDNRQRIFIGIPIGKAVQQGIDQLLVSLQSHSKNLRWVPAGNRHLTLAFLGDIPSSDVEILCKSFAGAYQQYGPFHYCLDTLERFPNARGSIVALTGEASEPLHGLAMATRGLLRDCGLGFERKKFRPHVTLARIRKPKQPLSGVDRPVRVAMEVNGVVMYQSTLTQSGSIYTRLVEAELL